MYIRVLCEKSLETISTKLNNKQLKRIFNAFIHGLKDQNKNVRKSCAGSLGIIATKVNVKQSQEVFSALITGLNDEDVFIRVLCAKSLGAISTELDDTQLKGVVNALKDEQSLDYFRSYGEAFEGISTKSNEEQSNRFFNALMIVSKRLMKTINLGKNILFAILLQMIEKRLNDNQLYLLVIYLLERVKERHTLHVQHALLKISEDMWKRVTIKRLKKDMQAHVEVTKEENIWERLFGNKRDLRKEMKLLAVDIVMNKPLNGVFPTHQSKWIDDNNYNDIPYPYLDNQIEEVCNDGNICKGCYTIVHEAARSGNLSQFKLALQNHPGIDINDSYNEHRQTPLHLAINNQHWDIARYCIEQGAYIDIREGAANAINATVFLTPFEKTMELIMKHKNDKSAKEYLDAMDMCKLILKQRTMYPMKRIKYAIDYVKDKSIDQNEGATFLLGVSQAQLKDMLIKNHLLYWAAGLNIISIKAENSSKKKFDEGWDPFSFLTFRIFLLFEICRTHLPSGTTFKQVYEKSVKELQVQLTTYWDYITVEEFKHKCSDLMNDWSCNVVNRLMNLKSIPLNPCCEMSLVVGHEGHCIYLSLCKTSDSILVRVDNRWMDTVPSNTPHPRNDKLIQPYLVAHFKSNGSNIDKNKEWLKEYIKNATILKDSDSDESMKHLYCSDNSPPHEGDASSIEKGWPYRPIQADAKNCYMRSHNVGYRIRLGNVVYQWLRNQESKSFVFNKTDYNTVINEEKNNNEKLMKILSKQLKVEYNEVFYGIAVEQALVAKANIHTIQSGAFYRRDESTNQTYFQLYLNSTERIQFYRFYKSKFPTLIQSVTKLDQEWVRFYFNTHVFYSQVIPLLSPIS
ncbi:hypothetical protein RFI_24868 [Reticulomyxa filosa]|uniref:Uncharacterized protein n=1 Tax=Reticulomyxa filosa TaxID=46433 RepID=X6MGG9_RETFI|nr:hypothetical protein RFI_24868 [Reticulomyxa filosa]|eukprot:ETO12507.1 hypothetical protein RFI_24868 [Reticulomyxa filosa]